MVKQGHYAKSSRRQRVKRLRQHHQAQADHVIDPKTVTTFLLVRYQLTQGKQQRPVVRKTMQHFLTQWLAVATTQVDNRWALMTVTQQTLQQFNLQLPWQGYAIIDQNWDEFQHFLVKEVPAVPLQSRLQVTNQITASRWRERLSQQLAVNSLLGLFGQNQQQLAQITTAQVADLQASLVTAQKIDWGKVAQLLTPFADKALATTDAAATTWLTQLTKMVPTDFD
ncbi:hypothetical protein RA086_00405 [Lactiplantibacillus sp. WILCCON 0030]|uniref:Uncharacterized protein n=1 Tax=Lactiplantibacillus brownii TaxID=3069269 RepID=A0ABU1A556_9LACO|nr:hypothetical protein [Lactiplantibacillus brownii]MDQ7936109.1 hypothetical protein [Lactiplantibacillus brownii]